jgi:hypothetical protein
MYSSPVVVTSSKAFLLSLKLCFGTVLATFICTHNQFGGGCCQWKDSWLSPENAKAWHLDAELCDIYKHESTFFSPKVHSKCAAILLKFWD